MNNYAESKSKLESFRAKYYTLRGKCIDAKDRNEKYESASIQYAKDVSKQSVLQQIKLAVQDNLKLTEKEYGDYKERRLGFVESENNRKLNEIFPSDNYRINLRVDNTRKEKIIFQLTDREGIPRSTRVSAGGLMKSVLAYNVSVDIAHSLGSRIAWLDEPFAQSSAESLVKLSSITEYYLSIGFQIFMVEHKEDGYKNLPRREFNLIKNLDTGRVDRIEYTDYE